MRAATRDLIAGLQSQIDQLTSVLNGKVSANSFADLRQRVTTAENTLTGKADTTTVNQQLQTITGLDSTQTDAITALQAALGPNGSVLQNVLSTQTVQANLLAGLRTDVNDKATAGTVSNLTGQVTALRNTVNDSTNGLAATKGVADAAKATADSAKGIADAALPKTGGSMVPGSVVTNLTVEHATDMTKAIRAEDVFDGPAPYRFFDGISATGVGATVSAGKPPAILPVAGSATLALTAVKLTNTGGLNLATTITITAKNAAGTVVFTHTINVGLGSLPAAAKLLDALPLSSALPANIDNSSALTFTLSASAGTYGGLLEFKRR